MRRSGTAVTVRKKCKILENVGARDNVYDLGCIYIHTKPVAEQEYALELQLQHSATCTCHIVYVHKKKAFLVKKDD